MQRVDEWGLVLFQKCPWHQWNTCGPGSWWSSIVNLVLVSLFDSTWADVPRTSRFSAGVFWANLSAHSQAHSQGIRKGGYILQGVWGSSPRRILNSRWWIPQNLMIFFNCQRNFGCPNIFWSWRKCQTSCKRAFPETVFNALNIWNTWALHECWMIWKSLDCWGRWKECF